MYYGLNLAFAGQPQTGNHDLLTLDGAGTEEDGSSLSPWDRYVNLGFGRYVDTMGYIDGPDNIAVRVDEYDDLGDGTVRTPILELAPYDYDYVRTVGFAHPGMMAISDTGDLYEYDGLSGLFSRIRKGFKKIVKKGLKKVHKITKKVLSKTKFGKALIKIGDKVLKTSMKIVVPLAKKVGKWAPRLAPVAALIPGVGPAISGAMLAAGAIGKVVGKYGGVIKDVMVIDEKTGKKKKVQKLDVDPKKKAALVSDLKKAAEQVRKIPESQRKKMMEALRFHPPEKYRHPIPLSKSSVASAQKLSAMARQDYTGDINAKIAQASGGNARKQNEIAALIRRLEKLGYRTA